MKALFVANIELKETEGIYKKVCAQADAIGNTIGECDLITRNGKNTTVFAFKEGKKSYVELPFFNYIEKRIKTDEIRIIYIRHMIPSTRLVHLLKDAKKQGATIYYEIPTYPYFAEQFRSSKRKYRAVAKISLDVIFWPLIYKYIDHLIIIKSNTHVKMYPKMVEITNGVRTDNIRPKDYNFYDCKKVFRMVAVGTLYPYHGYDRVLQGLAICGEKVGDTVVEFHIIGSSDTIDDLHYTAKQLGLNHVFFHGSKTTDELNDMFDNFDVGLGCMALHRRNANVDTTLKIIEYYCRGVPVVTSGISPMKTSGYTYQVKDDDEPINIAEIFQFYCSIPRERLEALSSIAMKQFSWDEIMKTFLK